jgi:predicted DCC family thiol-disulfide oxidoreductase YuxK
MTTRTTAYSYRDDPLVPAFDDSAPILIFDGVCVLCSSGVLWMVKRDPKGSTRFAAIQEPVTKAIYRHYGLDADAFDTFMVLKDGVPHIKWRALIEASKTMPAPWKWLGVAGQIVPAFIGDAFYDIVQKNRFSWFGERETCLVPDEAARARFLQFD